VRFTTRTTSRGLCTPARYDTKALWTLTMAIGQMCFGIPVALIARPIPGNEPHWSK
jgi:hypothetical protein